MSNEATPLDIEQVCFRGVRWAGCSAGGREDFAPPADDPLAKEDVLVRMNRELQRALEKPASERRWVMVIDLRRCIGCHACTVACVAENKLPPGVVYRPVMTEEIGTYPNVTMKFLPRPCMQCEKSPCTEVCPVNATYHNEEGIVVVDYEQCIGCRACMAACPYGARTFDFGYTYTEQLPVFDGAVVGGETAAGYEHAARSMARRGSARGNTSRRWATSANVTSACTASRMASCLPAPPPASVAPLILATPTIPIRWCGTDQQAQRDSAQGRTRHRTARVLHCVGG
jgi:Fe-S-cluster-containing hydrogenase component 2